MKKLNPLPLALLTCASIALVLVLALFYSETSDEQAAQVALTSSGAGFHLSGGELRDLSKLGILGPLQ